jgi:hypothetical protein
MTTGGDRSEVERAREGVERMIRGSRLRLRGAAGFLMALTPIYFWAQGPIVGAVLTAVSVAAIGAIVGLVFLPWKRRARRAARDDATIVAFHRTELRRAIRTTRQAAPWAWTSLALALAAAMLIGAHVIREHVMGRDPELRTAILVYLLLLGFAVAILYVLRVRLPELERALETER